MVDRAERAATTYNTHRTCITPTSHSFRAIVEGALKTIDFIQRILDGYIYSAARDSPVIPHTVHMSQHEAWALILTMASVFAGYITFLVWAAKRDS